MALMRQKFALGIQYGTISIVLLWGGSAFAAQEKKTIELGESVIEGEIQKPEAFFILQKATVKFEQLQQKIDFMKGIFEVITNELFE